MNILNNGQFHVKFLRITKADFFLIFCVKTIKLPNFKHYSPILSAFLSFGTIFFLIFKDFFHLEHLNKKKHAMFKNCLCFCLTSKHLETKLNYHKHIKFYEIHHKSSRNKIVKNFGVFNRYWHFWTLQPGPNLNPLATYIM